MSNTILNKVWPLKLDPLEKFTLIALADRADDSGGCWPSIADLVNRTNTSRRTVQRSISGLESKGHLTRVQVPGKGCRYVINPRHTDAPLEDDPRHTDAPPAPQGHPSRATQTPHPRHTDAQTIIEPSIEPSEEPSHSSRACTITASNEFFTPEAVATVWNEAAKRLALPQVRGIDGQRRSALKKIMAEHGPDDWQEAILAISQSDFLLGKSGGWQVNFDWLLTPKNFRKVLEGNYDRGPDPRADGFTRILRKEKSRSQIRNNRRAKRTDFMPGDLVPEVDAAPVFDDFEIPF